MGYKKILIFIKVIRDSFHDSCLVYSYGGCYGFHKILKHTFPKAKPYFDDEDKCHVCTKIGDNFYDIKGKLYCGLDKVIPMTKLDIEEWEVTSDGQRIEWMVAKYNKMCKRHQRD